MVGGTSLSLVATFRLSSSLTTSIMSMFDPLSVPNFPQDEPPWPTKPHSPSDPIPNLPRPSPHHEPRGPPAGLYGKEPQIYGQVEPALISPRLNPGSNGTQFERKEPYLRVRITALDRNRRDVLIKFDAQVCSPLRASLAQHSPLTHAHTHVRRRRTLVRHQSRSGRRTSRTSRGRCTGMCRARTSSSSSSTRS